MNKGEEVRSEMELVAMMLASVNLPDAGSLSYWTLKGYARSCCRSSTVIRVKHRTLGCVRSSMTGRVRSAKYGFGSLLETTGHWGLSVRSLVPERPVSQ